MKKYIFIINKNIYKNENSLFIKISKMNHRTLF